MDPFAAISASAVGGSAGLRLTLPLFPVSLSAAGILPLDFDHGALPYWVGEWYAAAGFGSLYLLERVIYLVPWLDSAADLVELPAAPTLGFLLSAGLAGVDLSEFPPDLDFVSTEMAVGLAGGLLALAFRAVSAVARFLANLVFSGPLVGLAEDLFAVMLLALAAFLAWLALVWALAVLVLLVVVILRLRSKRMTAGV